MLYGYCVRHADDPAPGAGITGIDGGTVRAHRCVDLALWVSDVEGQVDPSEERLRQHERVVREALRSATPLPLRFGTVFASAEAAEQAVGGRSDAFRRTLDRVAGLVEMGIRVEHADPGGSSDIPALDDASNAAMPTSGRAYLERRRAEIVAEEAAQRKVEKLLGEIGEAVGELVIEVALSPSRERSLAGRVACLVRRSDVAAFRAHVTNTVQTERPELRLGVTGPWAPYSFANE